MNTFKDTDVVTVGIDAAVVANRHGQARDLVRWGGAVELVVGHRRAAVAGDQVVSAALCKRLDLVDSRVTWL